MTHPVQHRSTRLAGRLLLATLGLCLSSLAQAAFVVEPIPGPTAAGIQIFGINNKGELSGHTPTATGADSAVYDLKRRRFEAVAAPAGYQIAVLGTAETGQLVGSISSNESPDVSVAFVLKNGNFTTFTLPGYAQTSARAINNHGTVTGLASDPNLPSVGFAYDLKTQTFTPITIGGAVLVIPQGVNNRGDIVGSATFPPGALYPGSPGGPWGFLMRKNGPPSLFRVNNSFTRARGISDSGDIAGFIGGGSNSVGFVIRLPDTSLLQSVTATPDQLIAVPGALSTFVQGIDNTGRVAGWSIDANNVSTAFVARPGK